MVVSADLIQLASTAHLALSMAQSLPNGCAEIFELMDKPRLCTSISAWKLVSGTRHLTRPAREGDALPLLYALQLEPWLSFCGVVDEGPEAVERWTALFQLEVPSQGV